MIRHLMLVGVFGVTASAVVAANPIVPGGHKIAQKRHGWMARGANPKHPWLYVASFSGNFSQPQNSIVSIYDMAKFGFPVVGTITAGLDGPSGIKLDASGNLYVANFHGGNVAIYAPGATQPSLTLSEGLVNPSDVAVDAVGDVYVLNRGGSVSDIEVFPAGQTTPSQVIKDSLIQVPGACIFDSTGNLYVGDAHSGVYVLPAGSQQPQSLNLQDLSWAAGLALDENGNLFVGDLSGGPSQSVVKMYPPGSQKPKYKLPNTPYADFLGTSVLHGKEYLMVPASQGDTVTFFKDKKGKSHAASFAIFTPNVGTLGVAFKPAAVP